MTRSLAALALASLLACGDASSSPPTAQGSPTPIEPVDTRPLGGPVGEWKWHEIPGAVCGNGDPTGIGVSIGTSRDVLIYLEGGGACWNEATCGGFGTPSLASFVVTGYHKTDFDPWTGPHPASIFDRTLAANPYKDASIVFVPYCTGDLHSGSTVQTWSDGRQMHYAGRQNLELYIPRIAATFPDADRITLSGSSAGGFGSQINYWRVKAGFGEKRVDLVADSGPLFKDILLLGLGSEAWNLPAALPAGCADCATDYSAYYTYYASTYPTARFAFLSFDADQEMLTGTGTDVAAFQQKLRDLVDNRMAPTPNTRFFGPSGKDHTMLYRIDVSAGGRTLGGWLGAMKSDDPTWATQSAVF